MSGSLNIDIVTIFPQMLDGFHNESILKRAAQSGLVNFRTVQLRDFTDDNHRSIDDRPYGGGPGMVMMPEPIFKAVESVRSESARIIMMTPQGKPFNQKLAEELSEENHLIFISGHYEGFDERVRTGLVTDEISIGDYVLTNGVLSAAVVIDAVVRLRPGVLGDEESSRRDSFSGSSEGLLEGPQYTRPAEFRGMSVPEVLLSGDHGRIAEWRKERALERTRERRPDLME